MIVVEAYFDYNFDLSAVVSLADVGDLDLQQFSFGIKAHLHKPAFPLIEVGLEGTGFLWHMFGSINSTSLSFVSSLFFQSMPWLSECVLYNLHVPGLLKLRISVL